jgi:DNA adenine methylase
MPVYSLVMSTLKNAKPFLKWAGGKRQLLSHLRERVPTGHGSYHEPFIGGGALFFDIAPERAVIADFNLRLVRTYTAVRDHTEAVIDLLSTYPNEKPFYLDMRARDIDKASDEEVAAWMIFLNRTGFNGLYRVNQKGGFNVPFGRYKKPNICNSENLRAAAKRLAGVEILHADFRSVEDRVEEGDFVYFDPPYVPASNTASFTAYTKNGFGLADQSELRDLARRLKEKGVSVLLSNSSVPEVHALYAEGFEKIEIFANRAINCNAAKRGKVAEALIW